MEFGIQLATAADSWKIVQRAEALGFTHAWFYDTQMLCADPFVAMGAAAVKTTRIRLGTGVLVPSNRIAPATACALASLNQLAPGRIDFGVGTGFTARRAMGLPPVTLAELEEYLDIVQALLAEETPTWEFEGKARKIRFLNPEYGLIRTDPALPVHISAMGPRSQRLTAERGAHWITAMTDVDFAASGIAAMNRSYRAAGRDPDDYLKTAFVGGCVLRPGEDYGSPRVKAQAGPFAAVIPHNLIEAGVGDLNMNAPAELSELLDGYRRLYDGYEPADARYLTVHRGHALFLRPEEEPPIGGDLIRAATFTGLKEELRERLRALRSAGLDRWAVQIPQQHPDALDDWAEVIAGV
ncbi:MAG: LLM class flavin-dependent oxidoreductase [Pseudomonadales bacterium]|nr:LLM class flavin-dependent oxidoreductase [Pseudomonadales bacterium]